MTKMKAEKYVTAEDFMEVWLEAYKSGQTMDYVANKLRVSKKFVSSKASNMRKRGVKVPDLQRVAKGRLLTPDRVSNLNAMIRKAQK